MTPAERADPKIINGSRRLRIANGSGVTVIDVNHLVNRFFEARKMMKQMAGPVRLRQPQRHQAAGEEPQGQEGQRQGRPARRRGPRGRPPGCRTSRRCRRSLQRAAPAWAGSTSSRPASTRRS